jgi:signal transduction histidine kinase
VLFIFGIEDYTGEKRRNAVEAYAGVISNSLWHFEPQAPTDYLTLIVAQQDYESFRVLTDDGLSFVDVQNNQHTALTTLLLALKLIKRVEITTPIKYNGEIIGEINAIWLNKNIYTYFYALIVFGLLIGIIGLYSRILQSNRELEIRVHERTAELHNANIELGESEARYRSIFEDSPISLREEDFSEVKKIVDQLRRSGVKDFRTYFDQHPETVAECVRVVKVLNLNQNTLELFKTDNKERLYEGLTDIFTEESLVTFGQQLAAFANGETHFDCETIQQTVRGEKLWAGTRVSIAPGYEESWAKVFISILDITDRKGTEAELANHREHLEELVTARTTELIALQHDLEQRVAERTEELAQVNIGLNAEIVERKRLQEEVHRYTEELEQRVADRTRDLSVLYDVTAVASNVLDLDELLSRLLGQSLLAIRRNAGIIHLLDESGSTLQLKTEQGVPRDISDGIVTMFANRVEARDLLEKHSAFIITDLESDSRLPQIVRESGWRTYIGMPIQDTRGQLSGILNIFGETDEQLTLEELTLLSSIADHIGLAVENVRLRHQAEQAAVQEDRQRLARELHDAVSQSLFSASVIAETLPRLWERDPLIVQQYLGDLHRLIRGALAEMRMLLLELRPKSMENAVLEDLLHQLMDGIQGRTQLEVSLQIQGQGEFPTRVKKNLFRIAQEALNNVVKHARAQHVELILNQSVDHITLCISDDGQGFEDGYVDGGHLGLQIMHERADNIGADMTISSRSGQGTEIVVIWPGTRKET